MFQDNELAKNDYIRYRGGGWMTQVGIGDATSYRFWEKSIDDWAFGVRTRTLRRFRWGTESFQY